MSEAVSIEHPGGRDTTANPEPVRPLRIALLGYRSNPYSGGQGVYMRYVSRALAKLGHEVEVISGEPYPELDASVTLTKLPGLNLYATESPARAFRPGLLASPTDLFEWTSVVSGGFPEPLTFGRRVFAYLKTRADDFDVVHDNQTLSYGVAKLPKLGLPLVTTIHHPITYDRDIALANTSDWGMRLLIRRWHRFLSMQTKVARALPHIVTVSESSKRDIASSFGVPHDRIEVIYNGVDAELFAPRPQVPRAENLLITTASADQPLKGTQHLLPAFRALRQARPDLRLIFIGAPKQDGPTARYIAEHDLAPHIEFRHGISNDEIVELYAGATLAVVPSEYEGFGLPAAEAMACGVPLVSTDGGALPEVVGDAGLVVPAADSDALCQAILALLEDTSRRERLGAAGRARMLARFRWDELARSLAQSYVRAIATQGGQPR